jgi:hypothetical protein
LRPPGFSESRRALLQFNELQFDELQFDELQFDELQFDDTGVACGVRM